MHPEKEKRKREKDSVESWNFEWVNSGTPAQQYC
jgi:hypothetical protein